MKPYVVREVDELRKTVFALQAQVQELKEDEKLDKELTARNIKGLKKTFLALEDRTSALEERADSEEQRKDPEEEKPTSPEDAKASAPEAAPSVGAIRRVFADGGWVILHGQCWRRGAGGEGERKSVMISDEEMEASGVYWRSIRGMTDQELLEKHGITRGGSKVAIGGRKNAELVSEREVEKENCKFLATLEEQEESDTEGDTEGDEAEADNTDESASSADTSDESAEAQGGAPDSSSNKELDLRRRRHKARRRAREK
jgi:hypothetical protein